MNATHALEKIGYDKCLVIIVEDDISISDRYVKIIQKIDRDREVVGDIMVFNDDSELKANFIRPAQSVIFVVDFRLHSTQRDEGVTMGMNMLNHIVSMGDNPVFVITGWEEDKELVDFSAQYPQITILVKAKKQEPAIEIILKRAKEYLRELKDNTLSISIESCLEPAGIDILSFDNSSIDKVFEDYYLKSPDYPQGKFFLAKCFMLTPIPFDTDTMFSWETKNISWTGRVFSPGDEDDSDNSAFLTKRYNVFHDEIVSIVIGEDRTVLEFYNVATFELMLEELSTAELTPFEKIIADHFVIFRIADLWLGNKLPLMTVIQMLKQYEYSGDRRIFESIFMTYLWEKKLRTCDLDIQKTNESLNEFHHHGFPLLLDVFYCRVNEKVSPAAEYVGTEVISADSPSQKFLREYHKRSFPEHFEHLIAERKTFKVIYYKGLKNIDPRTGVSSIFEETLLDEFYYLSANSYI